MTKKTKRLYFVLGIVAFAAAAVALSLSALRQSITYFYMPGDIAALAERPANALRLGGLVETGSIAYPAGEGAHEVTFRVTDGTESILVAYAGLLPDLFREGQGVIVQGQFAPDGSRLDADTVLAKHDENYMPKEVADALKEKGVWNENEAPPEAPK